ncbi:MAG: AIR synthase family protein [Lachnospiraceae bacterium]
MRVGKVSETALKRSVFQQLKTKREEVLYGPGIGEDCAAVKLSPSELAVFSTDPLTGNEKELAELAVYKAVNNVAVSGAQPIGILLSVLFPEEYKESRMKERMELIENACTTLQIQVMGGHTEVTRAVNEPVYNVTAVGKVSEPEMLRTSRAAADQDVVLSKWIGIEGTAMIAREREKELLDRFPKTLVENAENMAAHFSVLPEAALAGKSGVSAMHDVSSGGVYGALYELSEAAGVGLEIDLRAIPIRQETVEICEYFGLNPYYLASCGSVLMLCDNGQELVRKLDKAGIPAAVIGRTTSQNAKAVVNGGEISYLERPKADEWLKVR